MKRKYRKAQMSFGRRDDDLHMIFTHHTKQSTLIKFAKQHTFTFLGQNGQATMALPTPRLRRLKPNNYFYRGDNTHEEKPTIQYSKIT